MQPDSGTVKLGTNLQIAYFDQLRSELDPTKTLQETVSPGSDWVEVGGVRSTRSDTLANSCFRRIVST